MRSDSLSAVVVRHAIADITLACRREEAGYVSVLGVMFGVCREFGGTRLEQRQCPWFTSLADLLVQFLDGECRELGDVRLVLDGLSLFQRQVLEAARRVPWGTCVTYTELAAASGHPGAVRAAASVMRGNRFPLVVPCHRVIRKDGMIGGFSGRISGAPVELKRKLLAREGVELPHKLRQQ